MKSLHKHFNVECLPTKYGGKIEIPDGTGAALSDLFRLYGKEFDSKCEIELNQKLRKKSKPLSSIFPIFTVANSFGYDSSKNQM